MSVSCASCKLSSYLWKRNSLLVWTKGLGAQVIVLLQHVYSNSTLTRVHFSCAISIPRNKHKSKKMKENLLH